MSDQDPSIGNGGRGESSRRLMRIFSWMLSGCVVSWLCTVVIGLQSIRSEFLARNNSLSGPGEIVVLEELETDPAKVYRSLDSLDGHWAFVGNAFIPFPFIVSADIATGSPGYMVCMRGTFLWIPRLSPVVLSEH